MKGAKGEEKNVIKNEDLSKSQRQDDVTNNHEKSQSAENRFFKQTENIWQHDYLETISNQKRIGLPNKKEIIYYEFDNIIRCEADNTYTTFYIVEEGSNLKEITVSLGIGKILNYLPIRQFFRAHKRHIVNLGLVRSFHKDNLYVVMCDGTTVAVARNNKEALAKALSNY